MAFFWGGESARKKHGNFFEKRNVFFWSGTGSGGFQDPGEGGVGGFICLFLGLGGFVFSISPHGNSFFPIFLFKADIDFRSGGSGAFFFWEIS